MTDVPLALCLERDRKREAAGERFVGRAVIIEKYERYIKGKPRDLKLNLGRQLATVREYVPDASLPTAYVVDVDGTLARMNGRSPYDESRVSEDHFVMEVGELVQSLAIAGHRIVVMSGRTEACREDTEMWLREHRVPFNQLVMRRVGDRRNDAIVKEELFFEHVAPKWQVLGAIDDRNRVVEMWRAIGLMCAQVAPGDF